MSPSYARFEKELCNKLDTSGSPDETEANCEFSHSDSLPVIGLPAISPPPLLLSADRDHKSAELMALNADPMDGTGFFF